MDLRSLLHLDRHTAREDASDCPHGVVADFCWDCFWEEVGVQPVQEELDRAGVLLDPQPRPRWV